MKTICVGSLTISLFYFLVVYILQPAWSLKFTVTGSINKQDFHRAKQLCEEIERLRPAYFYDEANAKIGRISILAAQEELKKPVPDFSTAHSWLRSLLARGTRTGSEDRAEQLLKEIPSRHFKYAHELLLRRDYERALAEFEAIGNAYPDDPIKKKIQTGASIAEVEYVKELSSVGDPEAALERLARLQSSEHLPPVMVAKALTAVPILADQAIRGRLGQGNFSSAFDLIEEIDSLFTEPETLARLQSVKARIDLELFNVALDSGQPGKSPTARPEGATPESGEKAILILKNHTRFLMRLIYVGLQRTEITLPGGAERKVALVPGKYITGVYWPSNRSLKPQRKVGVLDVGVYTESFTIQTEANPISPLFAPRVDLKPLTF